MLKYSKSQSVILGFLMAATLAAWIYLYAQSQSMETLSMSEMWMAPVGAAAWTLGDFAVIYGMWAVMMAAMMLPAAAPMLQAYARASRRLEARPGLTLALFASAYLSLWLLFSIALTLLQWRLHALGWLSPMMENHNRSFAAAIFLLAGIYQFTDFKNTCLTHCKTPLGFLLNEWRPGKTGALVMGLRHGLNCIGCCWAEMLLMFAVGVMNLAGMALLTLLICVEKLLPFKAKHVANAVGVVLLLWGAYLSYLTLS